MSFKIGQKVVCVDDSIPKKYVIHGSLDGLRKGSVYTIREIGLVSHLDGHACVRVEELFRPDEFMFDCPYWAWRFRPLVTKRTDITVFTSMLKPEPNARVNPAKFRDKVKKEKHNV